MKKFNELYESILNEGNKYNKQIEELKKYALPYKFKEAKATKDDIFQMTYRKKEIEMDIYLFVKDKKLQLGFYGENSTGGFESEGEDFDKVNIDKIIQEYTK